MLQCGHAVVVHHDGEHGADGVPGVVDAAERGRRDVDEDTHDEAEGDDRGVVGVAGRESHRLGEGGGAVGLHQGALLQQHRPEQPGGADFV